MIGKLIFKLPEERQDFELAQRAGALSAFIEEFSNKINRRYKHLTPASDDAYAEYEAIRDEFNRMLNESDLDFLLWRA